MTTVYKEYLQAIEQGDINLGDVNFSVNGVGEYEPDENHTLADVTDIKCTVDSVLTGNCILTDSMSTLVDKIKERIGEVEGITKYVVFSGKTLCFCEGVE